MTNTSQTVEKAATQAILDKFGRAKLSYAVRPGEVLVRTRPRPVDHDLEWVDLWGLAKDGSHSKYVGERIAGWLEKQNCSSLDKTVIVIDGYDILRFTPSDSPQEKAAP